MKLIEVSICSEANSDGDHDEFGVQVFGAFISQLPFDDQVGVVKKFIHQLSKKELRPVKQHTDFRRTQSLITCFSYRSTASLLSVHLSSAGKMMPSEEFPQLSALPLPWAKYKEWPRGPKVKDCCYTFHIMESRPSRVARMSSAGQMINQSIREGRYRVFGRNQNIFFCSPV